MGDAKSECSPATSMGFRRKECGRGLQVQMEVERGDVPSRRSMAAVSRPISVNQKLDRQDRCI